MKKIIKTIKNNKEKGEGFPGGESGPLHLKSPVESSAGETTPTQSIGTSVSNSATLPDFRFPLSEQPARVLPGGSAREATAEVSSVKKHCRCTHDAKTRRSSRTSLARQRG